MMMAVQKPALKIPPTTLQEEKVNASTKAESQIVESFFMRLIFQ